ncbi:MAG: hypothetical protein ABI720_07925 [Actinomycetes bacterium]
MPEQFHDDATTITTVVVGGAIAGLGILVALGVGSIGSVDESPGAPTAAAAIAIGFASRLFGARLKAPPCCSPPRG